MQAHEIKEYYRQITSVDIGEVARELLGSRITENGVSTIQIDCPGHHSTSGKSLHVEVDKQLWRCWGCGISGDVLQLVEFVRHGVVTTGIAGLMTESHRDARNWLAEKAGLPKLSHMGLSDEEIKKIERREATLQRARQVLSAAADWYHVKLMENDDVKAWLKKQYAFTDEIMKEHRIGFADINGLRDYLYGLDFTTEELLSSGLFRPNETGDEAKVLPFFNQRVMFPYMSQGRVTYFIGRKCPLTPEDKWESGKYKKLLTFDPGKRPWVAEGIENNQLFNEDCLLKRPRQVIITEGITDCITLISKGFNSVSPVTTNIRQDDWNRLLPQLRVVKEVVICQDNEVSEAGWQGAIKTARHLESANISCRVALLPLDSAQEEARAELCSRFGITNSVGQRSMHNCSASEKDEVQRLLEAAKVDICSFFVQGHSAGEFQNVLNDAKSSVEYAIAVFPVDTQSTERAALIDDILGHISQQPAIDHDRLLRALQKRLGDIYRLPALRSHFKSCQQALKAASRESHNQQLTQERGEPIFTTGRHRYFLVDHGVIRETMRETPQGMMFSPPETLTNFHIRIDREVLSDDGEIHDDGTTIAETAMFGEIIGPDWSKPFQISGADWGSNADLARQITKVARQRAVFSTRNLDDIRLIATQVSMDTIEERVYTFFGNHPIAGFVTPSVIINDGNIVSTESTHATVDVRAEYNKARNLDLLAAPIEEVQSLVHHLLTDFLRLQPYGVTLPILAHAFIGPILFSHNFLQEFSPYILFIAGSSGKGKTETARFAQCLWGDFISKDKLAGWGSTPEINRQEAARCRGGLWLIDDFKRQKIGHMQWTNALRLLTDYADLQARKRATPGAKVISGAVIQGMLMVTGEDLPFNETSALARSLVVEFESDPQSHPQYLACLERHHEYRKIPAAFIAWWQKQDPVYWHGQLQKAEKQFMEFMNAENLLADNARRLASNAALSFLGMEAFLDFAYSIGCDPVEITGQDLLVEHTRVLREILRRMVASVNDARPGESFLTTLAQLLTADRVRIKDHYIEDHQDHGVPVIGYYAKDHTMIYLLTRLAMGAVRDAYKRGEDEPLYFSNAAIGKQLIEEGILIPDDNTSPVRRVRIPGGGRAAQPEWAWRLDARKLEQLLERYSKKHDMLED
jgi:hypothetical protein